MSKPDSYHTWAAVDRVIGRPGDRLRRAEATPHPEQRVIRDERQERARMVWRATKRKRGAK